jgi:hypothetical protein
MPSASTILATLIGVAFFGLCLVYARREGYRQVLILVATSVYGFLLEYLAIREDRNYHYARFPVMLLGTVPLMIAISWGGILYSVMRTSDNLRLKWYLRPIYDGILVLSIDLSLDPVAVGLGYWVWEMPPEVKPWFGVSLSNYFGWYVTAFAYSLVLRAGFRHFDPLHRIPGRDTLIIFGAIPIGMVIVFGAMLGYQALMRFLPESLVLSLLLGAHLVVLARYLPVLPHDAPLDPASVAAPLFFHAFLLFMLFASGLFLPEPLYATQGSLVILVPMIAASSFICFGWPYLDALGGRLAPSWRIREPAIESVETAPIAAAAVPRGDDPGGGIAGA